MRVNVETRGITRAGMLGKYLKIPHTEALGRLVLLWHHSQDEECVIATPYEITFWFDELGSLDADQVIDALVTLDFIRPVESEPVKYEIAGNNKHVQFLRSRREAGKRGGKASAVSRSTKTEPRASAHAQPKAKPLAQPNAIQCKANPPLPPPPRKNKRDRSETEAAEFREKSLKPCVEEFGRTLKAFRIPRTITPSEEMAIARSIQANGLKNTRLALMGAQDEPATDGFNPASYCDATRILSENHFTKNLSRGSQREQRRRDNQSSRASTASKKVERTPETAHTPMPQHVRDRLNLSRNTATETGDSPERDADKPNQKGKEK